LSCEIVAAGGYAGNKELLKQHYPFYTEDLHAVGLILTGRIAGENAARYVSE